VGTPFVAVSSPPKLPAGSNAGLDIRRTMFSRKEKALQREEIALPLFCQRYTLGHSTTHAQYYAVILKPGHRTPDPSRNPIWVIWILSSPYLQYPEDMIEIRKQNAAGCSCVNSLHAQRTSEPQTDIGALPFPSSLY
jgi:hypothetical protein